MNTHYFILQFIMLVLAGAFLGMSISHVLTSTQGDMNNDGVLDITDLSILASVINDK